MINILVGLIICNSGICFIDNPSDIKTVTKIGVGKYIVEMNEDGEYCHLSGLQKDVIGIATKMEKDSKRVLVKTNELTPENKVGNKIDSSFVITCYHQKEK